MTNKEIIENYKIIEKMCKTYTNNLSLIKDIKGIVLPHIPRIEKKEKKKEEKKEEINPDEFWE